MGVWGWVVELDMMEVRGVLKEVEGLSHWDLICRDMAKTEHGVATLARLNLYSN